MGRKGKENSGGTIPPYVIEARKRGLSTEEVEIDGTKVWIILSSNKGKLWSNEKPVGSPDRTPQAPQTPGPSRRGKR